MSAVTDAKARYKKYNMIPNGWLKKGKIPVKYSQPIHRKYVYKINQHSKAEQKIIS